MTGGMNFELTEDQELIRKSVAELAAKFDIVLGYSQTLVDHLAVSLAALRPLHESAPPGVRC